MKLYNIDGLEEDVQDPTFFMDEEKLIEMQESIAEILSDNY